jgi:hypothetical protein
MLHKLHVQISKKVVYVFNKQTASPLQSSNGVQVNNRCLVSETNTSVFPVIEILSWWMLKRVDHLLLCFKRLAVDNLTNNKR